MPFDASGNFTRNYNFVQDAANGIKILAARVDGEFDNIATGMNLVFFRDGRVPMQADLRMNVNGITGLKDGALGSPAIKFNTDPNTGPYLPGLNQYGIQVNGVQRGVFTTAGFDVTGNLTATGTAAVTGNITMGGNLVATQSWVNGFGYAPLASPAFTGVPTAPTAAANTNTTQLATTAYAMNTFVPKSGGAYTGNVTGPSFAVSGATGAYYFQPRNGDLTSQPFMYAPASNDMRINCGGDIAIFQNGGVIIPPLSLHVGGLNKTLLQHDGTDGYIRAETGKLHLGATGVNVMQMLSTGVVNILPTGGFVQNQGAGGTYSVGFSSQRNGGGQVGYHWYNGGGVTEWIMRQPTPGTGHDLRLGTGFGGVITDRYLFDQTGNFQVSGSGAAVTLNARDGGSFWVNYVTANIWRVWNNTSGADRFTVDASGNGVFAGNVTSSSDARLKSDVRDFENGLAVVRAMQPRRFNMNGKADFGFVAQELQTLLPEAVHTNHDGMLSVDYGRLAAPLAAAIKALNDRLDRAGL